jgi:hypothetical protein
MKIKNILHITIWLLYCGLKSADEIPSELIEQKCVSYGNYLSKISTRFMECAFNSSRPLNICKNCAQYYLEYSEIYNVMIKVENNI